MNFDEFSVLKSLSLSLSLFHLEPSMFWVNFRKIHAYFCVVVGRSVGDECVLRGCASIQFETNKPFIHSFSRSVTRTHTICRKVVCSFVLTLSRRFICSIGSFDTLRFCCYSLAHSLWCLLDLDLHRKYIIYITNINHLLHIKYVWLNSSCVVYILFEREIVHYTPSSYTLRMVAVRLSVSFSLTPSVDSMCAHGIYVNDYTYVYSFVK